MKIIILQLARLGDILQTLPTIQGLKKSNPDCEITLVARKKFADAARISPFIDNLVIFDTREMLENFVLDQSSIGKASAIENTRNWFERNFQGKSYDLLLNLTFSKPSAYLATMIDAKEKRGSFIAQDGLPAIDDSWSRYFEAQVQGRNFNMIHLNEIFCKIAGITSTDIATTWPLEINDQVASAKPIEPPKGFRVGIQLAASKPEKMLNLDTWSEICSKILNQDMNSEFVFFGSDKDLSLIKTVIESANIAEKSTIVAGTRRFHENVSAVKSCDVIISPDTAMIHLASVCQTRLVYLPLGGVRPEETGPYGDGHSILYPANANSAQFSDAVCKSVLWNCNEKKPSTIKFVPHSFTRFVKCSDGSLRNSLVPENFVVEETANLFMHSYYLLAEFRNSGRVEDIEIPKIGDPTQKGALNRLADAHETLLSVSKASEFAKKFCIDMLNNIQDTVLLKELSKKLAEADSMLETLAKSSNLVKPLIDSWRGHKSYVKGESLEELICLTEGTYRELCENIEIVIQLLNSAVSAAHERLKAKENVNSEKPKEYGNETGSFHQANDQR